MIERDDEFGGVIDDLDDGDFDGLARHALPAIREHIVEQLKERERPPAPRDAQEMRHELERLWHAPIADSAAACNLSAWHINKSEAGDLALNKLHTETPAEVERFIRMATSPLVRERPALLAGAEAEMTPAKRRAEKIAAGRVPCCVPHCGRTYKPETCPEDGDIICGTHFRLGSAIYRARMRKVLRAAHRTLDMRKLRRLTAIYNRLWDRVKKQAIERAVGI